MMHADSEGRTPLHWAVDRGHFKITEALVSRNADVNAKVVIVVGVTINWFLLPDIFLLAETTHSFLDGSVMHDKNYEILSLQCFMFQ